MYKRILVTLDESELSESVLPEVERMAIGSDSLLMIILTVASIPAPTLQPVPESKEVPAMLGGHSGSVAVESRLIESTGQALRRVEDELKNYLEGKAQPLRSKGLTVETVVRFGHPAQEIIDYAEAHDIDVIAMATHGRTGPSRTFFGSVAGRVLASGVKPVLMVRPHPYVDQNA